MSGKVVTTLLDRLESRDKDFRYMAASDLLMDLQKGSLQLDPIVESKLCAALLKGLQDSSSDVQSIALKALPLLLLQSEFQLADTVVEILVDNLLHISDSNSSQQKGAIVPAARKVSRDNCLITLKSIFGTMSSSRSIESVLEERIIPKLLNSARANSSMEVKLDCLDILGDIVSKFFFTVKPAADNLIETLFELMSSPHSIIRKRSVHCLASFLAQAPHNYFHSSFSTLISQLTSLVQQKHSTEKSKPEIRSCLSAMHAIGKAASSRLESSHINCITSLLLQVLQSEQFTEDEELYEYALQMLELFLQVAPLEMESFQSSIADVLETALKYNPNLLDEGSDSEGDESTDSDFEDDFTDDEDISCRVRRVAARCIHVMILARNFYKASSPLSRLCATTIYRIRERDEQVLSEVLNVLIEALKVVRQGLNEKMEQETDLTGLLEVFQVFEEKRSYIISKLEFVYRHRPVQLKTAAVTVIRELTNTAKDTITKQEVLDISKFYIKTCLDREANVSVQLEGIMLAESCACLFQRHGLVAELGTCLDKLVDIGNGNYYRITAQTLFTGKVVIGLLNESDCSVDSIREALIKFKQFAVFRLEAVDQDTEVKEAALECLSSLCSLIPSILGEDFEKSIRLMFCKLSDEFVRLRAVRAFTSILQSPSRNIISSTLLSDFSQQIVTLLRKKDDRLRYSCLECLNVFIDLIPSNTDVILLKELNGLIHQSEWRRTALIFVILSKLIAYRDETFMNQFREECYEAVLKAVMFVSLQGELRDAVVSLFRVIIERNASSLPVTEVFDDILKHLNQEGKTQPTVIKNLAFLVPIILLYYKDRQYFCKLLLNLLSVSVIDEKTKSQKLFACYALSELGYCSSIDELPLAEPIEEQIYTVFQDEEEELVNAGAIALGSFIRFTDSNQGILKLTSLITTSAIKERYLYLLAMKEAILCLIYISMSLSNHIETITHALISCAANYSQQAMETTFDNASIQTTEELTPQRHSLPIAASGEGLRSITSECLGILLSVAPIRVLPCIDEALTSPEKEIRLTSILAVRAALSYVAKNEASLSFLLEHLRPYCTSFFALLNDKDVQEHVSMLIPLVISHTELREDLVKTVDLGPFKHTVDEGVTLRKTAFEVLTLFSLHFLDSFTAVANTLVNAMTRGLRDQQDIRIVVQKLLIWFFSNHVAFQILNRDASNIVSITSALSETLYSQPKENAVAQEIEKHK
eukprot:jgi/Galph1/4484/GphlegSOOS_G3190.1